MNRRNFVSILGIATGASMVPITAATAAIVSKRMPSKQAPNQEPYNTFQIMNTKDQGCKMAVGDDGCLWLLPAGSTEWRRVALED